MIKEEKVWGTVVHLHLGPTCMNSYLQVNPGYRCSRHYHVNRHNLFYVVSGRIVVELFAGDEVTVQAVVGPGEALKVPPKMVHRFRTLEGGVVVETYWTTNGLLVDPNDIVRFDEGGKEDDKEFEELCQKIHKNMTSQLSSV